MCNPLEPYSIKLKCIIWRNDRFKRAKGILFLPSFMAVDAGTVASKATNTIWSEIYALFFGQMVCAGTWLTGDKD